jgi:hypothetical protein
MHGDHAISSPALDFVATIAGRERMGAFAMLDRADRDALDRILRSYHERGVTASLERQARTFLISYRELNKYTRTLDSAEREKLDQLLGDPAPPRPVRWRWLAVAVAVVLAAGLAFAIRDLVTPDQAGPPAASSAGQQAAGQQAAGQVPPGSTDLQLLKQDYGPWRQLTTEGADGTAQGAWLLLLQDGAYFASTRWTVPPGVPGWQPDLGGNVSGVQLAGKHASITDADGNPYTIGINQPFIVAGNPETVLRVDPAGTVLSMSLAQATAVRQPLGR